MRKSRYRYTARRRAALKRAQLISARKRSRNKKLAIAGAGVLAVGVGIGVVLGRKQKGREGNPIQVIKKSEAPPQAKLENKRLAAKVVENSVRNRVLITGSRVFNDPQKMHDALSEQYRIYGPMTIVHGAARGADSLAGDWGKSAKEIGLDVEVEVHPADWGQHGKAAGFIRNQKMVDLGANIVLAFPRGKAAGTRHAMKIARIAGLKIKEL